MQDSKTAAIVLFIIVIMFVFFFGSDKVSSCRKTCYCAEKPNCSDSCLDFLSFLKIEDCDTPFFKTVFQDNKSSKDNLPIKKESENQSQINELLNN